MRATHEHEFEAQLGLPEKLPKGEVILWQSAPDWLALANEAFHIKGLSVYFFLMLLLQANYLSDQTDGFNWSALIVSITLVAAILSSLALWAYMTAKASMYTVTNKRVVMRVGLVFSLTFNLPLRKITAANELKKSNGCSDLSLMLQKEDRIAWLHLWPHARPWHVNQPEPTLRCIKNGSVCADILKSAWLEVYRAEKGMSMSEASHETAPLQSSTPNNAYKPEVNRRDAFMNQAVQS